MEDDEHVYVIVKKKFIAAIVFAHVVFTVGIAASFQYAEYVNRQSDRKWCNIVALFEESYKDLPPTTELGKRIATEMSQLPNKFRCR